MTADNPTLRHQLFDGMLDPNQLTRQSQQQLMSEEKSANQKSAQQKYFENHVIKSDIIVDQPVAIYTNHGVEFLESRNEPAPVYT